MSFPSSYSVEFLTLIHYLTYIGIRDDNIIIIFQCLAPILNSCWKMFIQIIDEVVFEQCAGIDGTYLIKSNQVIYRIPISYYVICRQGILINISNKRQ